MGLFNEIGLPVTSSRPSEEEVPQSPQAGYFPQHPADDVLPPQSDQPSGRVHTLVVARVVVPLGEVAAVSFHRHDAVHDRMRLRR